MVLAFVCYVAIEFSICMEKVRDQTHSRFLNSSLLALWLAFEEKWEDKSQSVVQACSKFQEALDKFILVYIDCVCKKNKCKAQEVDNCKSDALSKWKWQLCAINGKSLWTKLKPSG